MHWPNYCRHFLVAWLITCAATTPAHADWLITPFIGLKFAGSTNHALGAAADSTRMSVGGMFTLIGDGVLGVDADFAYYPRFFEPEDRPSTGVVARSNVLTLMGNVVFTLPLGVSRNSLRPYASAGTGLMHMGASDFVDLFPVSANLLAVNFGGGAIGPLTPRTSLRFDVRYFRNATGGSLDTIDGNRLRLSFWRASIGVSLRGRLF